MRPPPRWVGRAAREAAGGGGRGACAGPAARPPGKAAPEPAAPACRWLAGGLRDVGRASGKKASREVGKRPSGPFRDGGRGLGASLPRAAGEPNARASSCGDFP